MTQESEIQYFRGAETSSEWSRVGFVRNRNDSLRIQIEAAGAFLGSLKIEHLYVFFLCVNFEVIEQETMWTGDDKSVPVFEREILRRAIILRASRILVMHNHPTGPATPSKIDRIVTQRLVAAGHAVNVDLIDHIIVSRAERFSMRAAGMIGTGPIPRTNLTPKSFAHILLASIAARNRLEPKLHSLLAGRAWLIVIALYRDMRSKSVKEITMVTGIPASVTLRYLGPLTDAGLIEVLNGENGRIQSIALSAIGREQVEEIIAECC